MQSVDLSDTVTLETRDAPWIEIVIESTLQGETTEIPADARNICHKAAALVLPKNAGVKIFLQKRIPTQAGLGGGSADAAAVLRGIAELFGVKATIAQAAAIGADVPFCLRGGMAWARGTGEELAPMPSLPADFSIALAKPRVGVSTKEAYAAWDKLCTHLPQPDMEKAVESAKRRDFLSMLTHCANVFEHLALPPEIRTAKEILTAHGAILAQMTGSGSCVFGIFRDVDTATQAVAALPTENYPFLHIVKSTPPYADDFL
jgi:4-diphosphocytidyl-2-C-methyl-D-erythritol kinase